MNSNINYNSDFIAERHNTILYTTSNLLPDIFKQNDIEDNYIDYSYNISLIDNNSNSMAVINSKQLFVLFQFQDLKTLYGHRLNNNIITYNL